MAARIIDGKAIAAEVRGRVAAEARAFRAESGSAPCLAVVLVGDDPASHTYIRSKVRVAAELGIEARDHLLPAATSERELLTLVGDLNGDPSVHGILVQLPLPSQIRKDPILEALDPRKDVDGFHPFNVGRLFLGGTIPMPPCTPAGIMELLDRSGVDPSGKEAVVVGRSTMVGRPVAALLLQRDATVTTCHSKTRDLPAVCRRAEILVVAIGRARMIGADHVRPGAVVIDVGTNRVDGKVVGDVDFDAVLPSAAAITPAPGGVGPMTIAMLMRNTVIAARRQIEAP
jgi:methylenetetrahydrofolate dehydrogenase (NADP+)/methenyltetrahydrofolate cyclohydrolase